MKILVVEDDPVIAQVLQILFSTYHYGVDIAQDGEVGLQMAETLNYDLFVLDVLLPRLDGINLCKKLRARRLEVPILLLTGQGEGHQKAIALNAGADDYVVKPFNTEELIARVQALLRRGGSKTQPILTWEKLSLNPSSRQVTYGNNIVIFRPKEYAILELFLRNPQKVCSPRMILDQVWSSLESPCEEAVRVHIKDLRKKLKDAGAPSDFIQTVYRIGYRLNSLYQDVSVSQTNSKLTEEKIAELKLKNEQLNATVEILQSSQIELRQKYQQLESKYQALLRKRQQRKED